MNILNNYLNLIQEGKRVSATFRCGRLGESQFDIGAKLQKICPKATIDHRGSEIIITDKKNTLIAVVPASKDLILKIGQKKPYLVTPESFLTTLYIMKVLKCKVSNIDAKSIKDTKIDLGLVMKNLTVVGCKVNGSILHDVMKGLQNK
jgi:hypothetical protein